MKILKAYQLNNTAVVFTGLTLLVAIYYSVTNLLSTYVEIETNRAESFWSVIQLQKELDAMYYQSQMYRAGNLDHETLKIRYELLWSRLPVIQNMLEKDTIFNQIPGLAKSIDTIFGHVKSMEKSLLHSTEIRHDELTNWIELLAADKQKLGEYIIHNLSGFDGDYVKIEFQRLLSSLITIATLIITFILYLGYLLNSLLVQQKRNRFLLAHDSLTGLKSRHYILKVIEQHCRKKKPFTLVNFDLNKFKQINDSYGHQTGDQVLAYIAEQFRLTIGLHGEVGRVGGDEFLWIADSIDQQEVNHFHSLLLKRLRMPFQTEDKNHGIQLKTSAGAGFAVDYNFHPALLMEEVDKAMYCAKKSKMPGICWESSLNDTLHSEKNILTSSRQPDRPDSLLATIR